MRHLRQSCRSHTSAILNNRINYRDFSQFHSNPCLFTHFHSAGIALKYGEVERARANCDPLSKQAADLQLMTTFLVRSRDCRQQPTNVLQDILVGPSSYQPLDMKMTQDVGADGINRSR